MPEGKGWEPIFPLTINGPPNLPTKTRIQRRSAPPRLASPNRRCLDELTHARCTPRPRGQGKEPVDRYGRPSRSRNPDHECSPSLRSAPHLVTGEPDVLTHPTGIPPSHPPTTTQCLQSASWLALAPCTSRSTTAEGYLSVKLYPVSGLKRYQGPDTTLVS